MSREDSAEDSGQMFFVEPMDKFWNSPELVYMLLPYLDAASTLRLAQAHFSPKKDSLFLGLLRRPLVWNKLIGRSLPESPKARWEQQEDMMENKKSTIECLAEILKMLKDPLSLEVDLLLLICKNFPPVWNFHASPPAPKMVHVSHHLPPDQFSTHSVSPFGFVLLESVLGSTVQKIERIKVDTLREPWLTAVSRRASHQGRKIDELKCWRVECCTKESVEAFCTLVNHCQSWTLSRLEIDGELGPDGWEALRKALCSRRFAQPVGFLDAPIRAMIEGRREDLKAIWESVSWQWTIKYTKEVVHKRGPFGEDFNNMGWRILELLMDKEKEKKEKEDKEKEDKEKEKKEKEDKEKEEKEDKEKEDKEKEEKENEENE